MARYVHCRTGSLEILIANLEAEQLCSLPHRQLRKYQMALKPVF